MRSWLGLLNRGVNVAILRHEAFERDPQGYAQQIAEAFGLTEKRPFTQPDYILQRRSEIEARRAHAKARLPHNIAYIRSQLDHDLEQSVGYDLERADAPVSRGIEPRLPAQRVACSRADTTAPRQTARGGFVVYCASVSFLSSRISNHMAFRTANMAASGRPRIQAKYHIVGAPFSKRSCWRSSRLRPPCPTAPCRPTRCTSGSAA